MRKWLVLTVLILGLSVLASGMVLPGRAEAYNRGVHKQTAIYARQIWSNPEIDQFAEWIYAGARNEDVKDHVWNHEDVCVTITHFWNPDDGISDTNSSGGCSGNNAAWKALILWGMALGEYYHGDKEQAYELLGHIAHLIGDMSVPAHAHDDTHVQQDSFDDDYMNEEGTCEEDPTLPECLSQAEADALLAGGPVVIPEGSWNKLYWLFYTTAQIGNFYASMDDKGNSDDPEGWAAPFFARLEYVPECIECEQDFIYPCHLDYPDCDLAVIRRNSYLHSIPAIAALYKLFAETVEKQAELTVVIDRVLELECHDDTPTGCESGPDYYVRIGMGWGCPSEPTCMWFRNEGSQQENTADVSPHWAFAYNVGFEGAPQVQIELWDDDAGSNPDDLSDIYTDPDEERRLWLTVDLKKCISGEDGAVSGDLVGRCGDQLTSAGDDDDRSQIWFRILAPNVAPTANAGPDQVANEGDMVTLNGSFTDNADDTQTFLWHLESSTNGQAVPDSTAQLFSFKPFDNGVYTFKFTVTDNHGAKGSDTVVVTVQNVPPVVSALYVSNQPNTEFILPVVHSITFKGTFTDAGTADTHTAAWNWGDGTTSTGNVTETNGSGSVSRPHTYSLPGDYTVTLAVTDDDGDSDSNTMTLHVADMGEALTIFDAYIQSLPATLFKNNASQRKAAFDNMFGFLRQMLSVKNYSGMILSMSTNIRTKFDGLVGGKPNDDWIVENLAVQKELCQKVDDITSYLQSLQSTSH